MSSKEKPVPPGDFECCESGCSQCVWDIYSDELEEWKAQQKSQQSIEVEESSEESESE